MKSKIFISYARKDYDVVVRLRDEIHRRTGSLPWMDLSGIETGAQFADVIAGAIDECSLLVFVISRHSVVSEWTRREVLYALEGHKKIYPIVIDGAQMPKELRLLLSNLNCVDIRDAVQRETLFSDLATDVNQKDSPVSSSHRRGLVAAMINGIKSLRFKMTMALVSRSWVFYAVISILLLIAAVYIYVSYREQKRLKTEIEPLKEIKTGLEEQIEPLKKFKTDTEDMFERSRQESLWGIYCTDFTKMTGIESPHKRRLATIEAVDKVKAAKFRSLLDQLEELNAKEDALLQSIVELHKVAQEKKKKGIYITEEFYQAEKIYKEKNQLHKTKVKPLEAELEAMWKDFKAGRKVQ